MLRPSVQKDDTIAAIATAPGRGGIGVIRISGARAADIARGLLDKLPTPRSAKLCTFRDENSQPIDQGLAIFFAAPHSYTGENVLELQGHGGPAVLQRLLKRCLDLGARLAQPGEFTQRAYLNNKLDLAQAESVADLIDAASEQAAISAMRSLQGEFSREIRFQVETLIQIRMLIEATLDFPEEETDFLAAAEVEKKLAQSLSSLQSLRARAQQGALLRDGLQVVLLGQPNVGKSSLLNCLARAEVAIVTAVAGTTRDTVREAIQIHGVPIHIVDTAGLRESTDEVECIGMARTWAAVEQANVALLVMDACDPLNIVDQAILKRLPERLPVLRVFNKIDLLAQDPAREPDRDGVYLSAKTNAGIDQLRERLLELAGWQQAGEDIFLARERHLIALAQAQNSLEHAQAHWPQIELVAEELRQAQTALSAITGEFTADDLLGEIFSRFCIGK